MFRSAMNACAIGFTCRNPTVQDHYYTASSRFQLFDEALPRRMRREGSNRATRNQSKCGGFEVGPLGSGMSPYYCMGTPIQLYGEARGPTIQLYGRNCMGDCMGLIFSEKHGEMKTISKDRIYWMRLLETKLTLPCFCPNLGSQC